MNRRRVLGCLGAGGVAVLLPLGLAGCGVMEKHDTYRFRMTVEMKTPQGVMRGSSVYEVQAQTDHLSHALGASGDRGWGVKGEAVVVDLPQGPVFALMKTTAMHGDLAGMSMTALDPAFHNDVVESAGRIASGKGINTPADVAPKDWPLMVRFRDLNDPKSVEAVDPQAIGVTRIWVETTRDAVTTGIEKRLGWFDFVKKNTGGNLIPLRKNGVGPGTVNQQAHEYDETMLNLGLSDFNTEAYK